MIEYSSLPKSREARPSDHGFVAWSNRPEGITNSTTVTAGKLFMTKLWLARSTRITKLAIMTRAGGTGATSLANCYAGLLDVNGNRLGLSSDRSSDWGDGVNGTKVATLTETSAGSLDRDSSVPVLGVILVGTQSTTVLTAGSDAQQSGVVANANLLNAAGTAFLSGVIPNSCTTPATGVTAIPTSVDMTTVTPTAHFWMALLDS